MKKTALLIACAGLIVGGMSLAAPKPASAGIRVSFGTGGFGYNRGYSNYGYNNFNRGYGNFNRGYNNFGGGGLYGGSFNRGYGSSIGRGFNSCRPPVIVPHGNHLHVIPSYGGGRGFGRGH